MIAKSVGGREGVWHSGTLIAGVYLLYVCAEDIKRVVGVKWHNDKSTCILVESTGSC